ncbi:hypothetical protein D9757_004503 [Collybiopsis confluens]|uniref:Uncharacterized protein n=1 Tax=Collybiopsis confluens TaxID=2823264 RepID=A0A8H5HWZ1_9AGAR|nr:hypothetical protein D9757_004503 [Collybiopsis confluens]
MINMMLVFDGGYAGVAVYFLSPLWSCAVGALLVLDEGEPTFVDLRDYSRSWEECLTVGRPRPGTVSSTVAWYMENLEEGDHSLRVEFPQGEASFVVLDALTYSTSTSEFGLSSESSLLPIPTSPSAFTASTALSILRRNSSSSSSTGQSTAPIVGAVVGTISGILVIAIVVIYLRCRGRVSTRTPRMSRDESITIEVERDERDRRTVDDRDLERSVVSVSSVEHETSVLSTNSRSVEQLLPWSPKSNRTRSTLGTVGPSSVAKASDRTFSTRTTSLANYGGASASRSTVAHSPTTPSRPFLPPIITKQLPALPPTEEEGEESQNQSAIKYGRSIISAVSRRFTPAPPAWQGGVGPNTGAVQKSGSTSSATSSFFPKPLYEEDRGMISRQQSLRGTVGTPTPASTELPNQKIIGSRADADASSDISEKRIEGRDARRFPVKPIRAQSANDSGEARILPVNPARVQSQGVSIPGPGSSHEPRPVIPQDAARPPSQKPSSSSTTIVRPLPPLTPLPSPAQSYTPTKKKPVTPLTIIPENNDSSGSVVSKEENSSPLSPRTSKRLSGGKIRLEKERHRRRRPRTPVTPQGPRPRPLPSPPGYPSPLPSASSHLSSDSAASTSPGTPRTPSSRHSQGFGARRKRPLPQTLSESGRPPSFLGPHILVPLKNINMLGATQSPQVELPLPSTPSLPVASRPPPSAQKIRTPSESNNSNAVSPSVSGVISPAASATPLRQRSGPAEHTLSLPSSLQSSDPSLFSVDSYFAAHGLVPNTPPPSAASSSETGILGSAARVSPRRLPPEPLRPSNARRTEWSSSQSNREIPEVQYLTVAGDINAPPPYSGRRIADSSTASTLPPPIQRALVQETVIPHRSRPETQASDSFNRHMYNPRSIPETPSEWRTSSAEHSQTASSSRPRHRKVSELDDTAAQLLFELLDDNVSTASSLSSIRPLSFPVRASRVVSVPPPLPMVKTHDRTASVPGPSRTLGKDGGGRSSQDTPPVPKIQLPDEAEVEEMEIISLPQTPKLPPITPRSPFSPLVIPPHPITPPLPLQTNLPGRRCEVKFGLPRVLDDSGRVQVLPLFHPVSTLPIFHRTSFQMVHLVIYEIDIVYTY